MIDESGSYDVRKIRKSGNLATWVTILLTCAGVVAAWATNANRLSTAEQRIEQGAAQRDRIEIHLSTDDQQIAVLKEQLRFIIEQLTLANQKLDRAEEERRR